MAKKVTERVFTKRFGASVLALAMMLSNNTSVIIADSDVQEPEQVEEPATEAPAEEPTESLSESEIKIDIDF